MKICKSRAQVDWLEGELVKLTGYEAHYWIEITRHYWIDITREDGEKEWCRSSDLRDVTYDEKLNNQRYLYVNGDNPIPVVLSGYVYKVPGGRVYYSAGKTIDEQRMYMIPINDLIKVFKREDTEQNVASTMSGYVETV